MKKHQTDTVSLVFAVIFLGVVCWWLAARFTELTPAGFGLMVAGTLITAGLIGLVSALRPRKPAPAAGPSSTAGLSEPSSAEHYAPVTEEERPSSFGGLDLDVLSEEDRARADELIRKINESRAAETTATSQPPASEEPTAEIPRAESPVTRPEWPEEPDTPGETTDRKSDG